MEHTATPSLAWVCLDCIRAFNLERHGTLHNTPVGGIAAVAQTGRCKLCTAHPATIMWCHIPLSFEMGIPLPEHYTKPRQHSTPKPARKPFNLLD